MMDTDDVALWYAFHRLTTSYWYEVDFNGGQEAHEFYLPDALFAVGDNRFEGKSKIHGFCLRRQRHGRITTRHLVSNLKVIPIDARHARLIGVINLHYADAPPPVRGTHPPMMVADIAAECVLGDDARWRFRSHVLSPVFVGENTPMSLAYDARRL